MDMLIQTLSTVVVIARKLDGIQKDFPANGTKEGVRNVRGVME
jgi:hypothetical protein